jgi:hypothetical protein
MWLTTSNWSTAHSPTSIKILTRFFTSAYIRFVMRSTRTFFYFAFTFRSFFYGESGLAICEKDVLRT